MSHWGGTTRSCVIRACDIAFHFALVRILSNVNFGYLMKHKPMLFDRGISFCRSVKPNM